MYENVRKGPGNQPCPRFSLLGGALLDEAVLTVNEVKVMHIPPKPFRAKAMKISTESAVGRTQA